MAEASELWRLMAALGLDRDAVGQHVAREKGVGVVGVRVSQLSGGDRADQERLAGGLYRAALASGFKESDVFNLAGILAPSWAPVLAVAVLEESPDPVSGYIADLLRPRAKAKGAG